MSTELGVVVRNEDELTPLNAENNNTLVPNMPNPNDNNQLKIDSDKSFIKQTRNLIRKENDYKLADRLVFTAIIWIEQISMILVIQLLHYSERFEQSNINTFYFTIIPLFVVGQLLEGIYCTYLNPEAKYRQRRGFRKMLLTLVLSLIFLGCVFAILYLLHDLNEMGYLIIILTIIVVLILSIVFYGIASTCCKRDYVKRQEREIKVKNV